jgi:hypothetical protein
MTSRPLAGIAHDGLRRRPGRQRHSRSPPRASNRSLRDSTCPGCLASTSLRNERTATRSSSIVRQGRSLVVALLLFGECMARHAASHQGEKLLECAPELGFIPVLPPPCKRLFQRVCNPVARLSLGGPSDSVTLRLHQTARWRVRLAAHHAYIAEIRPRLHQTALHFSPRRRFQVPSTPPSSSGRSLKNSRSLRFGSPTRIGNCHLRCHSERSPA